MMEDAFSFYDMRLLEEELDSLIGQSIPAGRLLHLVEAEDTEVVEEAFATMERCRIALDISGLPQVTPTGSDALRLQQEAQLKTLEQILTGLAENDPLRLYLKELEATPVTGDLQLYATRYLQGEHHLAEELLHLCLGAVTELALQYTGYGVLLLDLIQEGNMGLWQCLPQYEGGDFQAHATWWIRQYMAQAVVLHAHNSGLGIMLRQDMERYAEADRELLASLGRNPTREELAKHLGMEPEEILTLEKMMDDARIQQSEKQQAEQPETTPEDDLAVEDTAYFQLRQRITELLSTLTDQERRLLTLRFGLEGGRALSPEQTGKQLGMTPAQVVQAEAAALAKLRTQ